MACPYVTNADALTQSLEDIEEQGSKPDKLQPKKVGNKCLLFLCDMTCLEKTKYKDHHGDQ